MKGYRGYHGYHQWIQIITPPLVFGKQALIIKKLRDTMNIATENGFEKKMGESPGPPWTQAYHGIGQPDASLLWGEKPGWKVGILQQIPSPRPHPGSSSNLAHGAGSGFHHHGDHGAPSTV